MGCLLILRLTRCASQVVVESHRVDLKLLQQLDTHQLVHSVPPWKPSIVVTLAVTPRAPVAAAALMKLGDFVLLWICQWPHIRASDLLYSLRSVAGRSAKLSRFDIEGRDGLNPSSDVGDPEG